MTIATNPGDRFGKYLAFVKIEWVDLNSGKYGSTSVQLIGRATQVLDVEPPELDFGNVPADGPNAQQVINVRRGNTSLIWDDLSATSSTGHLRINKKNSDDYQINVEIKPEENPIGLFKDDIKIALRNHGVEVPYQIDILATAKITSTIRAYPDVLFLGVIPSGCRKTGAFDIVDDSGEALQFISDVQSMSDVVSLRTNQVDKSKIRIFYSLNAQVSRGSFSGNIHVRVRSGLKMRILSIPLIAYIK